MAFNIPKQAHRVYKNSFLQNTQLVARFNELATCSEVFADNVKLYYNRFFGLEKSKDDLLSPNGIFLQNEEDDASFLFTRSSVSFERSRKTYRSFVDSVLPLFAHIKIYIYHLMDQDKVDKLSIRKVNLFPIQIDDDKIAKKAKDIIYKNVFGSDFLKHESHINQSLPNFILDLNSFEMTDENYQVNVKYGLSKSQTEGVYNIVLDMLLSKNSSTEEGVFDAECLRMNDVAFDLLHWAVADQVIEIMKGSTK